MDAVRRFILLHRRLFAAAFAGLAVLAGLTALKPSTAGELVVVARHDLPSGATLGTDDIHTVEVVAKPSHAHTKVDPLIGKRVAAPMREGEALTDYRVLDNGLLDGHDDGMVLATVQVADAGQLAGLPVGGRVNVIATDPQGEDGSTVIARRAEIAAAPEPDQDDSLTIVLIVPEKTALHLATAALDARIAVLSVP